MSVQPVDDGDLRAVQRDIRPYVYATFDLLMMGTYLALFRVVLPTDALLPTMVSWGMIVAIAAMTVAMFVRNPWGWWLAVGGCAALLALAIFFLLAILVSAAFLAGVYGSFGRAASMAALAAEGTGGIPASPVDRTVRIDYVQHACSALIRAIPLVESPPS